MWQNFKDWLRRRLDAENRCDALPSDDFAARYEDRDAVVEATICNKLAMLTMGDSSLDIYGDSGNARAELISNLIGRMWKTDFVKITAQIFGKGGKIIAPAVANGRIDLYTLDQNRMTVYRQQGREITGALLVADSCMIGGRRYYLLADYSLTGKLQTIRYSALNDRGEACPLCVCERWKRITPVICIDNTDRLLFAYVKCPRDNRKNNAVTGVPITYGAQAAISELSEHCAAYRREYRLKRPMLGLDSELWKNPDMPMNVKPMDIGAVKRTVQDEETPFVPIYSSALDSKTPWQLYAPEIQHEAMEARYQTLCRRIEKECGLSQGILTERRSFNYANRDEVRAAQYDTYSVVRAMRDAWERAIEDLAYAVDVLAECFGLTACGMRGRYTLRFDWDMSLVEPYSQTWEQMCKLQSIGGMSTAELRAWLTGERVHDAQEQVDRIAASGERI